MHPRVQYQYSALVSTIRVPIPHSPSSLHYLIPNQGPLEHVLLIPTTLQYHASDLRPECEFQLPPPTDEFVLDEELSSACELLSRSPEFAAQVTAEENHIQGTYEGVIWLVLTEFRCGFQLGNEVHSVAAQLPCTLPKRPDGQVLLQCPPSR